MKALVKKYAEPGIWMEDVPMPEVGVNDVLIKVKKAAICGTDLHMYKWDAWSQAHCKPPYTMGHEFVGEVAWVGVGVKNFKVGERVNNVFFPFNDGGDNQRIDDTQRSDKRINNRCHTASCQQKVIRGLCNRRISAVAYTNHFSFSVYGKLKCCGNVLGITGKGNTNHNIIFV